MKLSVLIPAKNAEKTIDQCLGSIYGSVFKDFEVIVVDDNSSDKTADIARRHGAKVIETKQPTGEAAARNEGVKYAKGLILVFIDSDVIVKKDTLETINNTFSQHEEISALTGILSKDHPNNNFFSQFKNLYMNYIFHQVSGDINFLYGSIHAIRKNVFEPYDWRVLFGADTELGHRLSSKGLRIVLLKNLEVIHLKKYTMLSFILNNFNIPFYWAQLFLRSKFYKKYLKGKRFAHSNTNQILSIPIVFTSVLFLFAGFLNVAFIWAFVLLVVLFFMLNRGFFKFLKQEKGIGFAFKAIFVAYLDALIMGAGIFSGTIAYYFKKH